MHMSTIESIRKSTNTNINVDNSINMYIQTETMDLDEIASQAYNEEMGKKASILDEAKTLYEKAKTSLEKYFESGANVSSSKVESSVANENKSLNDLTKSALDQLESNSGIKVIRDGIDNKALDIQIEKDNSKPLDELNYEVIRPIKEGTTGTVSGEISPGTKDTTFAGQRYQLDAQTMKELIATVYSEASESKYLESDAMGVTSVILNRCEDGSGVFKNSVKGVLFQDNQFEGTTKTKFQEAMKDPSVVQPQMVDAINRVLNGERNTDALYFVGRNDYNEFRKDF